MKTKVSVEDSECPAQNSTAMPLHPRIVTGQQRWNVRRYTLEFCPKCLSPGHKIGSTDGVSGASNMSEWEAYCMQLNN